MGERRERERKRERTREKESAAAAGRAIRLWRASFDLASNSRKVSISDLAPALSRLHRFLHSSPGFFDPLEDSRSSRSGRKLEEKRSASVFCSALDLCICLNPSTVKECLEWVKLRALWICGICFITDFEISRYILFFKMYVLSNTYHAGHEIL